MLIDMSFILRSNEMCSPNNRSLFPSFCLIWGAGFHLAPMSRTYVPCSLVGLPSFRLKCLVHFSSTKYLVSKSHIDRHLLAGNEIGARGVQSCDDLPSPIVATAAEELCTDLDGLPETTL